MTLALAVEALAPLLGLFSTRLRSAATRAALLLAAILATAVSLPLAGVAGLFTAIATLPLLVIAFVAALGASRSSDADPIAHA